MQTITIGGQARAFHVGTNQGDIFCRLQGLSLAQYAATFSEIGRLGFGQRRDFIYSALKAGADRSGQALAYDNLAVGDWMDEPEYDDVSVLAPIVAALGEQFAARKAYQDARAAKNAEAPATGPKAAKMEVAS